MRGSGTAAGVDLQLGGGRGVSLLTRFLLPTLRAGLRLRGRGVRGLMVVSPSQTQIPNPRLNPDSLSRPRPKPAPGESLAPTSVLSSNYRP